MAKDGNVDGIVRTVQAMADGPIVLPSDDTLLVAEFVRDADDLRLETPDGGVTIVTDYFSDGGGRDLMISGAVVPGRVVGKLARAPKEDEVEVAYAEPTIDSAVQSDASPYLDAAAPSVAPASAAKPVETRPASEAIAEVTEADGEVFVTRPDGAKVKLDVGDLLFEDDLLATSADGSVGVTFVDGMTFSLSNGGRMVLDEFAFSEETHEGGGLFSVLQGKFSFVSGAAAHTREDALMIETPTMTIGVRGTKVVAEVAADGSTSRVALLAEEDGRVGKIMVKTDAGEELISDPNRMVEIDDKSLPPSAQQEISSSEVMTHFGSALDVLPAPTQLFEARPVGDGLKPFIEPGRRDADTERVRAEETAQREAAAANADAEPAPTSQGQEAEGEGAEDEAAAEASAAEGQETDESANGDAGDDAGDDASESEADDVAEGEQATEETADAASEDGSADAESADGEAPADAGEETEGGEVLAEDGTADETAADAELDARGTNDAGLAEAPLEAIVEAFTPTGLSAVRSDRGGDLSEAFASDLSKQVEQATLDLPSDMAAERLVEALAETVAEQVAQIATNEDAAQTVADVLDRLREDGVSEEVVDAVGALKERALEEASTTLESAPQDAEGQAAEEAQSRDAAAAEGDASAELADQTDDAGSEPSDDGAVKNASQDGDAPKNAQPAAPPKAPVADPQTAPEKQQAKPPQEKEQDASDADAAREKVDADAAAAEANLAKTAEENAQSNIETAGNDKPPAGPDAPNTEQPGAPQNHAEAAQNEVDADAAAAEQNVAEVTEENAQNVIETSNEGTAENAAAAEEATNQQADAPANDGNDAPPPPPPSNAAPILDTAGKPALPQIPEDATAPNGAFVRDIVIDGSIVDPDGPTPPAIAVVATDETHGRWEYSLDGGATFLAVGQVDPGAALLLDSDAKLRFIPNPDFVGSASIDYRAWDQSAGAVGDKVDATANGGDTAFSKEVETAKVGVFDVNDVAPSLTSADVVDVAENVELGATLYTARAVDADTTGEAIVFSLADDAGGLFVIDAATGDVSLATGQALDFETATSHSIVVRASDGVNASDTTVTLNVLDVNDSGQVFAATAPADVLEDAAAGTIVFTASASDLDTTGEDVFYTLVDDAGGRFVIDQMTGVVTVSDDTPLDFEAATSHDLIIRSSDGLNETDLVVTINVLDANDEAQVFTSSTSAIANENVVDDVVIYTAAASDVDTTGEAITYSLVGDAGGLFEIDAASGEVSLATGQSLDYETAIDHDITIRSSDGVNTTDQVVRIHVNNINDTSQQFISAPTATIAENVAPETAFYTAVAVDPESDPIAYSLLDDAGGLFTIDPITGDLSIAAGQSLDYETATSHSITIRSSDGVNSTDRVMTINVEDVNDSGQVFVSASSAVVAEDAVDGSVVYTAIADDLDGTGEAVAYSLVDDAGGLFEIDAAAGVVTLAAGQSLDYETAASHTITIRSSDGVHTTDLTVTVNVTDVDEFSLPLSTFSFDKGSAEAIVNERTTNDQEAPAVTALADGGYVIVWQSAGQDGDHEGVFGQRFAADGATVGSEFQVNTKTVEGQELPSVVGLADGGFVVVWQDNMTGSESDNIVGQRYDAAGVPQGGEFTVNSTTHQEQIEAKVAALSDGGFVVVWESKDQDADGKGVFLQRYDAAGVAQGPETLVNTYAYGNQENPDVVGLAGGGFVVVWDSADMDGDSDGVFGQRYDASGAPAGGEFRINTETVKAQKDPSVTALSDGGFVVAWTSDDQDGDKKGVFAQRYDAAGNEIGSEFQVNTTTTSDQDEVDIIGLADGGFLIAWTSKDQDGDGDGVFAQRYDSAGTPIGGETLLSEQTADNQSAVSLASLADGSLVATWQTYPGAAEKYEIAARTFETNNGPTIEAVGAVSFNGVDGYVDMDDPGVNNDDLDIGTSDFTVEAWFYYDGSNDQQTIVSKGASYGTEEGYRITIYDGDLTVGVSRGGLGFDGDTAASRIALTEPGWHHVAMVVDQQSGTGTVKGYLNGSDAGWTPGATLVSNNTFNAGDIETNSAFQIGADQLSGSPAYFFKSDIADVRLWDKARSANEIQSDMARALNGDEANLLANWRLDDGGGDAATNTVAGGPLGAVVDGATFVDGAAVAATGGVAEGRLQASDLDGDQLTFSIETDATNGTATIDADTGVWTYDANSGFTGVDTVSYQVSDGHGGVDTVSVSINVT